MFEFSTLFFVISLLVIVEVIWAFGYLAKENKFVQLSSKAKAIVVDVKEVVKNKKSDYEIMVSFRDQHNNEIITEIKQLLVKNFRKGDMVDIFYLNANPKEIHVNRWDGISLISNSFFALSAVMGIYALLYEFILN